MEDGSKSTRERVLDVALDLFVEQGYDKASLREIAERVGFTKAALYYHFASKADILRALHDRMHTLLERPLGILGDGPVNLATYEKFLDACIDGMQANQKLFVLHQTNQAAFEKVHVKGHEGAHLDIQERARALLSDPALSPKERLRMVAAFALAFVTPIMANSFLGGEGPPVWRPRRPVTAAGDDPPAAGDNGPTAGDDGPAAGDNRPAAARGLGGTNFVDDLKELVRQVLYAPEERDQSQVPARQRP